VTPDGPISDADAIIAWLDAQHDERADVERHRAKRRADWPLWVELHGPGGPLS
jgi:glutathione S-transferase